jgi:hypothetical protein
MKKLKRRNTKRAKVKVKVKVKVAPSRKRRSPSIKTNKTNVATKRICARCNYTLPKNSRINLCQTCAFERFILSAFRLNEYI